MPTMGKKIKNNSRLISDQVNLILAKKMAATARAQGPERLKLISSRSARIFNPPAVMTAEGTNRAK